MFLVEWRDQREQGNEYEQSQSQWGDPDVAQRRRKPPPCAYQAWRPFGFKSFLGVHVIAPLLLLDTLDLTAKNAGWHE